jgi:hypothetical protein
VKPAYDGTTEGNFFPCCQVPFHKVFELWILGILPLKTGFRYAQAPFKTGFTVNDSKKAAYRTKYRYMTHNMYHIVFVCFSPNIVTAS